MRKSIFIVLIFALIQTSFILHPVNIAVTDITPSEKKLLLKFKFFADDLQSSLNHKYKLQLDFINKGIDKSTVQIIQKFVKENFKLAANNVPQVMEYKTASLKDEILFVEYEIKYADISKIKNLKITNTLLFYDFQEQKNLVNSHLFNQLKIIQFENGSEEYTKEVSY